eukprot:TRINITY_DN56558_c0_g1_i1.p1 TRINITY_DN56558_c0_g1~~TRINITY_DN56558_c0_g1_i1.p1  ORF type:complete len:406 (+),score=87.17 TRINITY_DN56558_c0_g1_i1:49-1266(+)
MAPDAEDAPAAPDAQVAAPAIQELPEEFLRFLDANGVPKEVFSNPLNREIPRYVRVNPRGRLAQETQGERAASVAQALGVTGVQRVDWLPFAAQREAEVYACAASTNLSRAEAYKDGSLYGVDAASVFAACCLGARPGETVLDLCCAPGAKLCTLSDAVGEAGHVVGVDIAEQRLAACRTVLLKYSVTNVRLALGDGTSWTPSSANWFSLEPPPRGRGQRGRKRRLEAAEAAEGGSCPPAQSSDTVCDELFDRVLVDAECTHDASWRHLEKFRTQWGWDTLGGRVPWVRQEGLFELQLGLLSNGFRSLKPGGSLIYATCSLCQRQNEDVVSALLQKEDAAALEPLPLQLRGTSSGPEPGFAPARPSLLEASKPLGEGGRYCTARFDPVTSGTSGLFVARVAKRVT